MHARIAAVKNAPPAKKNKIHVLKMTLTRKNLGFIVE